MRDKSRWLLIALAANTACSEIPQEAAQVVDNVALVSAAAPSYASSTEEPATAISWGPGRIDVFARDPGDQLQVESWTGASWNPSELGFTTMVGSPSVVSTGPNRLDVFARGEDGNLHLKSWDGSRWLPSAQAWDTLGRPSEGVTPGARPAAVSWAEGRIDLFVPGSDRMLYIKSWDGTRWLPSEQTYNELGGPIVGAPEVVSWGPNRVDVFVRRDDGKLHTKSWNGAAWLPSEDGFRALGAPAGTTLAAHPAAVSWGPDRIDVVVSATDGQVYVKSWDGTRWVPSELGFNLLGAPPSGLLGAPKVVSWGPGRLDVFVRGNDGNLYIKSWTGSAWAPSQLGWVSLAAPSGAALAAEPSLVSWGPGRIDVIASASDRNLYIKSWTGSSWSPSDTGWNPLGGPVAPEAVELLPFWSTDTMYDESVLMVSQNGGLPRGTLLWPAAEIIAVRDGFLGREFTRGVDWNYDSATNTLSLPSGSHAPSVAASVLTPNGAPLVDEHHFFHSKQLAVTYRHARDLWRGPAPTQSDELSTSIGKLSDGGPLRVTFYGDSITVGYSASGIVADDLSPVAPYLQRWPDLVADRLRDKYGADVQVNNPSVIGQTSAWGKDNVEQLVNTQRPDLVVIAFGMNDGTQRVSASTFSANIQAIMTKARCATTCEFILVAPMLPLPGSSADGNQRDYLSVLTTLASQPHVALADMTTVHAELLERKAYVDTTGNGINHPNDFVGRWYAQLVVSLLGASS